MQASDHDCKQVVFLSDALSVLQAYLNHKLLNLAKALQQVAATRTVVLQRRMSEENSMPTMPASMKRRL